MYASECANYFLDRVMLSLADTNVICYVNLGQKHYTLVSIY